MGYKIIKEVIKEKPSKACVYDVGENNIIKYNLLIFKKKMEEKLRDHTSTLLLFSVCFPYAPMTGHCQRWDTAVMDCCSDQQDYPNATAIATFLML